MWNDPCHPPHRAARIRSAVSSEGACSQAASSGNIGAQTATASKEHLGEAMDEPPKSAPNKPRPARRCAADRRRKTAGAIEADAHRSASHGVRPRYRGGGGGADRFGVPYWVTEGNNVLTIVTNASPCGLKSRSALVFGALYTREQNKNNSIYRYLLTPGTAGSRYAQSTRAADDRDEANSDRQIEEANHEPGQEKRVAAQA
jgi:hypothetical protein